MGIHNIEVRNVNWALYEALLYMLRSGIREDSRNGKVIVAPEPVCTTYAKPLERVLFSSVRDANPFFHLMEALWMLGGRNDVTWPTLFNSKFSQFSDNGSSFWGAYGYRWRRWFGYDQLSAIATELKMNPTSRRCVLAMWDGEKDLDVACGVRRLGGEVVRGPAGKDVPCNTHVYFDCRGGRLNATVCCRSNDVLWGAYGANAVHFAFLAELMAAWVEVPVGELRQFSNNFHIYTDVFPEESWPSLWESAVEEDCYLRRSVDYSRPLPLISEGITVQEFLTDLDFFLQDPEATVLTPFLVSVAQPMYRAWVARKEKRGTGLEELSNTVPSDWVVAGRRWIERREAKKEAK